MGLMDDVDAIVSQQAFNNPDSMPGVESFTYYRNGKKPVQVNGAVERRPPELDPATMTLKRRIEVFISIDQLPSVDCPGDRVSLAIRRGGTAQDLAVKEIITQDAGGWTLLLG